MKINLTRIITVAFILGISIVLLLFQPTYLHFDMPCMEITKDGTHLNEGSLLFTGLKYHDPLSGNSYIIPFDFQIPEYQGYEPYPQTRERVISRIPPANLIGFIIRKIENDLPKINSCDIVFHDDGSCCTVCIDGRYFAGSTTGDYDAALELYDKIMYIPDRP